MMAILGRIMQGFDRTPNPKCTAPGGRAALGAQLDTRLCHWRVPWISRSGSAPRWNGWCRGRTRCFGRPEQWRL